MKALVAVKRVVDYNVTGFDPTRPGGGTSGSADAARNNYNRAMSACLQGRGYQVN